MKAFEVKLNLIGGSKGQAITVFVKAKSAAEIKTCDNVLSVKARNDLKPENCSWEIKYGALCETEPTQEEEAKFDGDFFKWAAENLE